MNFRLTLQLAIILIAASVIPIVLNFALWYNVIPSKCDNDSWLQFWGSYLGGPITLVAVLLTQHFRTKELQDEFLRREEAQRIEAKKIDDFRILQLENERIKMDYLRRDEFCSQFSDLENDIHKISHDPTPHPGSRGYGTLQQRAHEAVIRIHQSCSSETLKKGLLLMLSEYSSNEKQNRHQIILTANAVIFRSKELINGIGSKQK